MIVKLLVKRLQLADCKQKGYILEDYPRSRKEAELLSKHGIIPDCTFYVDFAIEDAYGRSATTDGFDFDRRVLSERIRQKWDNNRGILSYYQLNFDNVRYIDATRSKMYIKDFCIDQIHASLRDRFNYSRDLLDEEAVLVMENLTFPLPMLKYNHSEFGYFCPVTWKKEQRIVKCHHNLETAVKYKGKFYFFTSFDFRNMFISNPGQFLDEANFPVDTIPSFIKFHKAAELASFEKSLMGYCPVSITQCSSVDQVEQSKGYSLFLSIYKGERFVFNTYGKLTQFLQEPERYASAKLPVKMPPPKDSHTLMQLSELENSIPFLEQSVGQIATRALLEVGARRLKYPGLSK